MKLTKKVLSAINIHNPHNVATTLGNKIYVAYVPADNGRLTSHYAYWVSRRIDFIRPDNKEQCGSKQFSVCCNDEKETKLQEAIAWVKRFYNIDMTDKDVFGAYHPTGTLSKLEKICKS